MSAEAEVTQSATRRPRASASSSPRGPLERAIETQTVVASLMLSQRRFRVAMKRSWFENREVLLNQNVQP